MEVGRISKGGYEGAGRVAASLVGGVDGVNGKRDASRVSTPQIVNLEANPLLLLTISSQI